LFPTAPGYNPTLTIWALAYWAAAAILTGVGQRSSYKAADIDADATRLRSVIARLDGDTMIARHLLVADRPCVLLPLFELVDESARRGDGHILMGAHGKEIAVPSGDRVRPAGSRNSENFIVVGIATDLRQRGRTDDVGEILELAACGVSKA